MCVCVILHVDVPIKNRHVFVPMRREVPTSSISKPLSLNLLHLYLNPEWSKP